MTALVKYEAMCVAIAAAHAVDEVKDIRDKALAIQMYAHQAKNLAAERNAAEIRLRAERRAGELVTEGKRDGTIHDGQGQPRSVLQKAEVLPSDDTRVRPKTLAELGLSYQQSSDWQKLAEVPEETFEEAIREQEIPTASAVLNHRAQGTGQNEWYTPEKHIALVRDVLGGIDLDPASTETANRVVQAERFYTAEQDGLSQPWSGKVFLNPPYAQPLIAEFIDKLNAEVTAGRVPEAILLTHNYTDTAWFHAAQQHSSAICFTRGRIGFLSPDGKAATPTQGQAFFYYGHNQEEFAERFLPIGFVMAPCLVDGFNHGEAS